MPGRQACGMDVSIKSLARLEPFRHLDATDLRLIARHSRLLALPAKRWVLRRGQSLSMTLFLRRGRLLSWVGRDAKARVVRPGEAPLFGPGVAPSALRTQTAIELLQIDLRTVGFLLGPAGSSPVIETPVEYWVRRLLAVAAAQHLEQDRWPALLRALEARTCQRGERVVSQGEASADFFVLAAGGAEVTRRRSLARLGPGDWFGEDAAMLGQPRNATVRMLSDGTVMHLSRARFLDLLAAGAAAPQLKASDTLRRNERVLYLSVVRRLLCAREAPCANAVELRSLMASLDPHMVYRVRADAVKAQRLGLFILQNAGFKVQAA